MLEVLKSYSIFYAGARMFGLLPYTWMFENVTCTMRGHKPKDIFIKSRWWSCWSSFYLLFIICFVFGDIYDSMTSTRVIMSSFTTLVVFQRLYDFLSSSFILLLQALYFCKSDEAACLVQGYVQYVVCHPPPLPLKEKILNRARGIFFFLVGPFNFCFYTIGFYTNLGEDPSVIVFAMKVAISVTLIYFLTIMHYTNIEFAMNSLKELMKPIDDIFDPQRDEAKASAFRSYFIRQRKSSVISVQETIVNKQSALNDSHKELSLELVDFEEVEDEIVKVFTLCKKCNNYIDKPMAVTMFGLMMWILISTFHITLMGYFSIGENISIIFNFLTALIPTLDLLNNTHVFDARVSQYSTMVFVLNQGCVVGIIQLRLHGFKNKN